MRIRTCSLLAALLGLIAALPATAFADPIDVPTLTLLMIEDQGSDMTLLGQAFGANPSSPVMFTSNVNLSAMSYSFMSLPGSMYEGQSLTIADSGVYNTATNVFDTDASITLGAISFSLSGTTDISAFPYSAVSFLAPAPVLPMCNGMTVTDADVKIFPDGTDTVTLTNNNKPIPGCAVASSGGIKIPIMTQSWSYQASGNVVVSSVGSSPLAGGTGSFTATVSPVPEPSSTALFAFGISVLIGAKIRPRRRRLYSH